MKTKEVKINFGCFDHSIKGWINVDFALKYILLSKIPLFHNIALKLGLLSEKEISNSKVFKGVVYGDVRKRLKWETNSVDKINHTHLLEHLYYDEAIGFLKECHRILKPNGIMRICIPDFEMVVNEYIEGTRSKDSETVTEKIMGFLYAKKKGGQIYGHKCMYDKKYITKILIECDFRNIKILKENVLDGEVLDRHHNYKESILIEVMK